MFILILHRRWTMIYMQLEVLLKVYHWPHRQPIVDYLIFSFAKSKHQQQWERSFSILQTPQSRNCRFRFICRQRELDCLIFDDCFTSFNTSGFMSMQQWVPNMHVIYVSRWSLVVTLSSMVIYHVFFFQVSIDTPNISFGAKGNMQVFTPTKININALRGCVRKWMFDGSLWKNAIVAATNEITV